MPTTVVEINFDLPDLASAQNQVQALYQSLQQLETAGPETGDAVRQVGESASAASGSLGDLGSKAGSAVSSLLGLPPVTGEIASSVGEMSSALTEGEGAMAAMGASAVAAGAGVAVAVESINGFNDTVGTLMRLSDEFGITTAQAQAFRSMIESTGGNADQANTMLMRLTLGLSSAQSQLDAGQAASGRFVDGLNQLGISLDDSNGKVQTTAELMPQIIDKFTAIHQSGQDAAGGINLSQVAMDLFGRSGAAAIPMLEQLGLSYEDAKATAEGMGNASQENVQKYLAEQVALTQLHEEMDHLEVEVGGAVVPALISLADKGDAVISTVSGIVSAAANLPGVAGAFEALISPVTTLIAPLGLVGELLDKLPGQHQAAASAAQTHADAETQVSNSAVNAGSGITTLGSQVEELSVHLSEGTTAAYGLGAAMDALSQHLSTGSTGTVSMAQSQAESNKLYSIGTQEIQANLQGHTALAAAYEAEKTAIESGDPDKVRDAERNVQITQTQDALATSQAKAATAAENLATRQEKAYDAAAAKAAATAQQESDAAASAASSIIGSADQMANQYSADVDKMASAFGLLPNRTQADWQQIVSQSQSGAAQQLTVIQTLMSTIQSLQQQSTQIMSAEDRKALDDRIKTYQAMLSQAETTFNGEVTAAQQASQEIQKQWTDQMSAYTTYAKGVDTENSVLNDSLTTGARQVTAQLQASDKTNLDNARTTYAGYLDLQNQWQAKLLQDIADGDTVAQQYDKNLLQYLQTMFIDPAKASYDDYTALVKSDDQDIMSDWQNQLSSWSSLQNTERELAQVTSSSIIQSKKNVTQAQVDSDIAEANSAKQKYQSLLSQEAALEQQIIADYARGDQAAAQSAENQLKYIGALTAQAKQDYDDMTRQAQADYQALENQSKQAASSVQSIGTAANSSGAAIHAMATGGAADLQQLSSVAGNVAAAIGSIGSAASGGGSSVGGPFLGLISNGLAPGTLSQETIGGGISLSPGSGPGGGFAIGGRPSFAAAEGGILSEPIVGIGLNTGGTWTLAENGPEAVIPLSAGGGLAPTPVVAASSASYSSGLSVADLTHAVLTALTQFAQGGSLPVAMTNAGALTQGIGAGMFNQQTARSVPF